MNPTAEIIFDKSVPIPRRPKPPQEAMAILDKMEKGDSFEYPKGEVYIWGPAATKLSTRTDKAFLTRKVSESTRRIWRIE